MIILPSVYYGSTEYWAALVQGGSDVVVDLGEHYVKRSERNRTEIMTSGGVMQLSVQLAHANRPRQPIGSMRVDYSKRWQHQHLVAMESAYRSSPYYDYYADRFAPLYEREWERLVELNMAIMERVCAILKVPVPRTSASYVEAAADDLDLRPKRTEQVYQLEPYVQVFSDRMEFVPRLSIYDLIMCEGPEAVGYLRRAKR
ncbi:MAG: WbqC family protein [Alistipes sp.]|nr:WbqC family protein [Alistipes sp.]